MPAIMVAPGAVVDSQGTGAITPTFTKYTFGLPGTGAAILAVGDVVAAHGTHGASAIASGSAKVTIGGKAVAVAGSLSSCGGAVTATAVAKITAPAVPPP